MRSSEARCQAGSTEVVEGDNGSTVSYCMRCSTLTDRATEQVEAAEEANDPQLADVWRRVRDMVVGGGMHE